MVALEEEGGVSCLALQEVQVLVLLVKELTLER